MRSVTPDQRKAAAVRAAARRAAAAPSVVGSATPVSGAVTSASAGPTQGVATQSSVRAAPVPGGTPDYFGIYPNYANSPFPIVMPDGSVLGGVRKFIDTLPGLDQANQNNLGQYIPIAKPDTVTFPGSDYYEIGLVEYSQKLHTDLPATKLRGYVQLNNGTNPITHLNTLAPAPVRYLGPLIIAQKDRPVRVKFTNMLPTGSSGNLFLPVDTTVMGAGMGPFGSNPPIGPMNYTQNRASVHLHGGNTPWISDGTPHQWIVPAGEVTSYPKGVSQRNVPDMFFDPITHQPVPANTPGATNDPGPGSATFYYTNQQSARLMFYHDHAYGITRLNVYAGEAAPYILRDPTEQALITSGTIPAAEMPLVVQDKTFVSLRINTQDPTWDTVKWGPKGNLWFPHVYMPNQNPYDDSGTNAMGRWDYGPWFWPPYTGLTYGPVPNPYFGQPGEPPVIPGTPNPSIVPEAFMDTPLVNGAAYPTATIQPKAYRFRILNACNDRFLNLQLYFADNGGGGSGATATAILSGGVVTGFNLTNGGSGYVTAPNVYIPGGTTCATAFATVAGGAVTSVTLTCGGSGFTIPPKVTIGDPGEVKMVPAVPHVCGPDWPDTWPTDGRDGGVPDPMTSGPAMIQIGTEGGILPAPAIVPPQPINYVYNRRDIVVLNVSNHSLFLGPAERADVIVDFSGCTSGSTLILYNDAPAPVPAFDPRYDYYTLDPDQTDTGGAPQTLPGFGPNTRTVMQFKVSGTPSAPFNLNALNDALPAAFTVSQPVPPVPEKAYGSNVNTYVRIQDTQLTYIVPGTGTVVTKQLGPKAIQELFDPDYGRMNATLGVELPNTNVNIQTTIPYFYIDPPTEFLQDAQTSIWKITHNGVDTHAVHFHLFNVQLLNRVGWDGAIRPPDPNELGWKETVRMNPLEDVIVAMTPVKQSNLPFSVGDSIRLLNPTEPQGSTQGFTNIDPNTGNPITVTNQYTNFGNEYVWHCHLLGHEENDMMRPIVFQVAPAAPLSVVVTQTGLTQVSVAFVAGPNGGSPVTQFTATSSVGGRTATGTTTPLTITGLTQGQAYTFTVTATNAVGTGPASGASNSITLPTAAPAAPTNLVLTPSALSTNPPTMLLTWTRNSTNESGFRIQRAPTSGFGNVTTFNVGAGVTSYTDVTVAANTRYYYRVLAFNFVGNSAYSNVANALTAGQLPAAPTNLAVAGSTRTSITLNWTDNATNETGFYLNRSTAGAGGPWTRITVPGSTAPPPSTVVRTDNNLTRNKTYWYQVQAYNAYGTSTLSAVVSGTTLP